MTNYGNKFDITSPEKVSMYHTFERTQVCHNPSSYTTNESTLPPPSP